MQKILAGVALVLAFAGSLPAADVDWSGVYVGLNAGYNFGRSDAWYKDASLKAYSVDARPSGWSCGAQLGYNHQFENCIVAGIEGEFSLLQVSDRIPDTMSGGGDTIKMTSDFGSTLRLRLGYAMGRFLPYVSGGVAGANAEVKATDGALTEGEFFLGWAAGAGVEYAIDGNWSVRGEYLHVDLGRHTWFAGDYWATSSRLTSDSLRLGVNYKF